MFILLQDTRNLMTMVSDDDADYMDTSVPNIGERVVRGPDWLSQMDEDQHQPGTIVQHASKKGTLVT